METVTYITSLITFYLKGEIKQEQNSLRIKIPNTILSLIPCGYKNETIPINQISSVELNFKLIFATLVLGVFLFFGGFDDLKHGHFSSGIMLVIISLPILISSFQTILEINTTSGKQRIINFIIFERKKAELVAEQLNQYIIQRVDDTNVRVQNDNLFEKQKENTERQTEAFVDAINSLKDNK